MFTQQFFNAQEIQALYEQEVAICTLYLINNLRLKQTKVKKV